jgi:hypothetical protein
MEDDNKDIHWQSTPIGTQCLASAACVAGLRHIARPSFSKYRHGQ